MTAPAIRLLIPDPALMDAALAGDEALAAALGHPVAPEWASFVAALAPARLALIADPEAGAWGMRFFVTTEPAELVGWGGFKGPPAEGTVEFGYEIAACRRRRGFATAAIAAMLGEARADARVHRVIAHTLPESNSSNRLLEAAGFGFDAEAEERGEPVWRFALEL